MIHRYNLADLGLEDRDGAQPQKIDFKGRIEIKENPSWKTTTQAAFG